MKRFLSIATLAAGLCSSTALFAQSSTDPVPDLVGVIVSTEDPQVQLDILRGLNDAVKGRRNVKMPAGWEQAERQLTQSRNPEIKLLAQSLGLTFGSAEAMRQLRDLLADANADANSRRTALESLLAARDASLPVTLQRLLRDRGMRAQALKGLAAYEDAGTAAAVLSVYGDLSSTEKRDALNTLASRAIYAGPLLEAINKGQVPRRDLTAEIVRQLRNLKSPEVTAQIEKVWGAFRETDPDKSKEIERYKTVYRAGGSTPGDALRGRVVFAKTCQQCHSLFDTGGNVGPDLTGSNRGDLAYILENIVDPNAVIPNDYRSSTVSTKDDRVLTGIVKEGAAGSIQVITANETVTIPQNEIESVRLSEISMMPEGLLTPLTDQEVRDLIYYLGRPGQVPLLATADTVANFFNGKDLTGWEGTEGLWSVENGEIVGKAPTGLKHNDFLKSQMMVTDFRLICEVKLTPNKENSGIQFRTEPLPSGEVRGYQADAGAGWWGKLYEEEGRGLLWDKTGEQHVKRDDWNTYEILAIGHKIQTAVNGKLCVDLDDPKGALRGIIAFQLHSGGPMEARFRKLDLEASPAPGLKTLVQ